LHQSGGHCAPSLGYQKLGLGSLLDRVFERGDMAKIGILIIKLQ